MKLHVTSENFDKCAYMTLNRVLKDSASKLKSKFASYGKDTRYGSKREGSWSKI